MRTRQVVDALAKRRNGQRDRAQPVVEIGAEFAFLYQFGQRAIGRRDDADIDRDWVVGADANDFALLQHAKQRDLRCRPRSAISSSNSVPRLASSNLPMRRRSAPVKAPRSWPNSSLSRRPEGIAPQFNVMSGCFDLGLSEWMRLAATSLPTPVSPSITTLASRGRDALDRPHEVPKGRRSAEHLALGGLISPASTSRNVLQRRTKFDVIAWTGSRSNTDPPAMPSTLRLRNSVVKSSRSVNGPP